MTSDQSSLCCPALSLAMEAGSNRLPQMPSKESVSNKHSDGGMMYNRLVSGSPMLQLISICNISQLAQDRDQHGGRDDPAYCERTTAHRDGWSRIDADSLTSIPAQ